MMIADAERSDVAPIPNIEKMLAKATTIGEIRSVENLAQRARDYAKAARMGRDAVNRAARSRDVRRSSVQDSMH